MAMTVVDKDCTEKTECFVNTVAEANYERGYKDGYAKAIEEFAERLKEKYPYFVEDVGFVEGNKMLHNKIDEIAKNLKGE